MIVEVLNRTRNKMISAKPACDDDDGVATSSLTSDDCGEAVCYLCLDGGADDAGQPLRRDCACRGTDAGFVHLACLITSQE